MSAVIVTELPITRKTVEDAYRVVFQAKHYGSPRYQMIGRRAAKARDPKLLLALQKGSQILQQMSEEQHGPHGLDVGGIRVQANEFQLWRNAYLAVDEKRIASEHARGEPEQQYADFYGMAAILAGLT